MPRAVALGTPERKDLALQVLARHAPLVQIADEHQVSRKFLYRQAAKAATALDQAFASTEDDAAVLFYLPVTRAWLRQLVLVLVLVCHSSFRGVLELLEALFDFHDLSLGTVHNIVRHAIAKARTVNQTENLSAVRVGAQDEIFQTDRPVLVGLDLASTYCYLLAVEAHRDETTWGVHLLELAGRGLQPDYTIADFGAGLRAGQREAWPAIPCHGDVFHALQELGRLALFLDNRACGAIAARAKLEGAMTRAKSNGHGQTCSKPLALARQTEAQAVALADAVRLLAAWMQHDVLAAAGPALAQRRELYDYVVEELRTREQLCPHRIVPVRRLLEHQREPLLAFVATQDQCYAQLAASLKLPVHLVHAVAELQALDPASELYWQRRAQLLRTLGNRAFAVESEVRRIQAEVPRASSLVENLNSRLRAYFFLRRHIGDQYLELLRFFLNHRRFLRSDRPERIGKSPAELLTGHPHAHWLELLGYVRFRRA